MKNYWIVVVSVLIANLLPASGALAQGAGPAASASRAGVLPPPAASLPTTDQLIADLIKAETQANGGLLVYSYGQAVRDSALAGTALSHLMVDYYHMRSQSQTATQASQAVNEAMLRFTLLAAAQSQLNVQQNQRIIEQNDALAKQNQRIIELLEQIARK